MGYFDKICWKVVKYEIFWPIEFTKMFLKLFLFICGWSPLVRWFDLLRSLQNCLCGLLWINVVYFLSWFKFSKKIASIYRLNKKVGVGRMKNYWENTSVPVNLLSHYPLLQTAVIARAALKNAMPPTVWFVIRRLVGVRAVKRMLEPTGTIVQQVNFVQVSVVDN